MQIQQLIENANLHIPQDRISYEEPMKNHISFKVGGPAEVYIKVQNENELLEVKNFVDKNKIPMFIIGNGSNVLVTDKGIRGIVVQIDIKTREINNLEGGKKQVILGSGNKMAEVAHSLCKEGISGFEELAGIPGTIGGAIKMNAGAYGKEIKDILKQVKVLTEDGNIELWGKDKLQLSYRKSIFSNNKAIVIEAEFILQQEEPKKIKEKMDGHLQERKEKQPIEYPSAGSTFKRGDDFVTAKLIDEAGLKGYQIGGAQVSEKHAGFIINKENATAKDIQDLIQVVQKTIYEKFGKMINLEIEIIGEC